MESSDKPINQETTRERAARHHRERQAELSYTEVDYSRWQANRERVLAELVYGRNQRGAKAVYQA